MFLRYFNAPTNLLYSVRPFHAVNYYSRKFKNMLIKVSQSQKFDLVQIGFLHMAQYIDFLPDNVPMLLDTHNVEHFLMNRYAQVEKNILKRKYLQYQTEKLKKYEMKMYPRFDLCLMVSREEMEVGQAITNKQANFCVITIGVDLDYFSPPSQPVKTTADLIFTGTMSGEMNIDAVLFFYQAILPLIRKQIPDVKLTIAGANPDERILNLVRHDPYIEVTGTVPDIRPYMLRSKVLIVPLRIGAGIRTKIGEAMAMGIPIISTSIGCEGTMVTHGKDIIVADTPTEFANQTIRLLRDEKLRTKLVENGRKLVCSIYNWDAIVGNLYSTYVEVVKNQ